MDRIEKILVFVVVATIVIIVTIALSTSRSDNDDLMGSITDNTEVGGTETTETKSADGSSAMEGSAASDPGVNPNGDRSSGGDGLPPEVIAPRRSEGAGTAGLNGTPGAPGNLDLGKGAKGAPGSPTSPPANGGRPTEGPGASGKTGTASQFARGGANGNTTSSTSAAPSGIAANAIPLVDEPRFETVRKNDSYWKIAERLYGNGKHWKVLQDANKDVPASAMRPGIKIIVPEFEPAASAKIKPTLAMGGKRSAAKGGKKAPKTDGTYRIVTLKKGDYLYKLLRELKMTRRYREVLALNGMTAAQASSLREGHQIKIPTTPAKPTAKAN